MRNEKEVVDQVGSLVTKHFEQQIKERTRRLPNNCVHHLNHPMDVRPKVQGERNPAYNRLDGKLGLEMVGLCMYGSEDIETWPGNICEDEYDAVRCPWFTPNQSVDQIKEELENNLKDPQWVKETLPEVAALMWVTAGSKLTVKKSLFTWPMLKIIALRNWLLRVMLRK